MPFIPLKEFVGEHKSLVQILTTGTAQKRRKEARKQLKELLKILPKSKRNF